MYYTIYKDERGQFRWRARGNNHEPMGSGESYHNKADCISTVNRFNGLNNYPVHDETVGYASSVAAGGLTGNVGIINRQAIPGLLGMPMQAPPALFGMPLTPPARRGLLDSFSNPEPAANGLLSAVLSGLPLK